MRAQTVGRAWRAVRDRFAQAGMDNAALDARLLAEHAFGFDATGLAANERDTVPAGALERLDAFAERRLGGEPVARILGEKEFYGLTFGLNAATLVPRPETELVVELGLAHLTSIEKPRILDLGTGTGCIAVSLIVHSRNAEAVGVDIDAEALHQAAANARRHRAETRIALVQGSWFAPLEEADRFDLVVSNPPYIESDSIAGLTREVREHDPVLALDGGPDGLAPYRIIAAAAAGHLGPGGAVMVEIGAGQAQDVATLFTQAGFGSVSIHPDLAGIARVVVAKIRA